MPGVILKTFYPDVSYLLMNQKRPSTAMCSPFLSPCISVSNPAAVLSNKCTSLLFAYTRDRQGQQEKGKEGSVEY